MNNAYGFALWIWADLAVIALGGGAFSPDCCAISSAKDELKNIINYAVLDRVRLLQLGVADPGH